MSYDMVFFYYNSQKLSICPLCIERHFCYNKFSCSLVIVKGCDFMSLLGNIIWFIFGGLFSALGWYIVGLLWCVTIIGIPVGMQCFKFGSLTLFPFGKEIQYGGGAGKFILNILWLIFGGFELAVAHVTFGLVLCCTIIGIPFGLQHFKLAKLALLPFGAEIVNKA